MAVAVMQAPGSQTQYQPHHGSAMRFLDRTPMRHSNRKRHRRGGQARALPEDESRGLRRSLRVHCRHPKAGPRFPRGEMMARHPTVAPSCWPASPSTPPASNTFELRSPRESASASSDQQAARTSLATSPFQQPVPVLAEGGRVPGRIIHAQPYEPAEQQVVLQSSMIWRIQSGRRRKPAAAAPAAASQAGSKDR